MSFLIRKLLLILFSLTITFNLGFGQPGDPGGDPDIPIDGATTFLIAAGALLGIKKLIDNRKDKK